MVIYFAVDGRDAVKLIAEGVGGTGTGAVIPVGVVLCAAGWVALLRQTQAAGEVVAGFGHVISVTGVTTCDGCILTIQTLAGAVVGMFFRQFHECVTFGITTSNGVLRKNYDYSKEPK